jgi:hypothetical protein
VPVVRPEVTSDQLLKSQKNEVLRRVEQANFARDDFVWHVTTHDPSHVISRLVYRHQGDFLFDFEPQDEFWTGQFSPGEETSSDSQDRPSFSSLLGVVDDWLTYLRREIEAPDLWSDLIEEGLQGIELGHPTNNSPFTAKERQEIGIGIENARRFALSFNLSAQIQAEINVKLDYLSAAKERLGRYDWRALALTTAIDVAIAAAFNPDQARHLLQLIASGLVRLLGGGA